MLINKISGITSSTPLGQLNTVYQCGAGTTLTLRPSGAPSGTARLVARNTADDAGVEWPLKWVSSESSYGLDYAAGSVSVEVSGGGAWDLSYTKVGG